jgi:hypothetical protein
MHHNASVVRSAGPFRVSAVVVPACCGGSSAAAVASADRGRGEHGRTASVGGTACVRRRRTPSPAARFKESLELVSTAQERAGARPAADLDRLRDGRPPGRRFSVTVPVQYSYWYVSVNA